MKVVDIVRLTNKYLSGEQLTYNKLLPFLDATIDDINNLKEIMSLILHILPFLN